MQTATMEDIALETIKQDVISNGINELDASAAQKYRVSFFYVNTQIYKIDTEKYGHYFRLFLGNFSFIFLYFSLTNVDSEP